MIKRQTQAQISRLLKQFQAVAIPGPRQVGKTTLAKQLATGLKDKAIYQDIEKPCRPQPPAACIEIKLSNAPTVSKGYLHCIDDLKPKYKLIITPQSETYTAQHGVQITGIRSFLKEQLPLIK